MSRPRLLDLFCGAGGAAMGYHRAGFDVTGVDIRPMPRHPFTFIQGDALEYVARHGREFDVIHASPPCQAYSRMRRVKRNRAKEHPNLIPITQCLLRLSDRPYVIENVPGAPLRDYITLCGLQFGLRVYRHRLFESSQYILQPSHVRHTIPARHKHPIIVYDSSTKSLAMARAMGIDWMSRNEGQEAIPPAYTEFIGRQLLQVLGSAA